MSNKFSAQLSGHLTANNSSSLAIAVKGAILETPEGMYRAFRKTLIDPDTGKEVVITVRVRIGGCDSDDQPIKGRKQSLTGYFAVKLDGVESLLLEEKKEKPAKKETDVDELARQFGLS